jgi:hypothetical protein
MNERGVEWRYDHYHDEAVLGLGPDDRGRWPDRLSLAREAFEVGFRAGWDAALGREVAFTWTLLTSDLRTIEENDGE